MERDCHLGTRVWPYFALQRRHAEALAVKEQLVGIDFHTALAIFLFQLAPRIVEHHAFVFVLVLHLVIDATHASGLELGTLHFLRLVEFLEDLRPRDLLLIRAGELAKAEAHALVRVVHNGEGALTGLVNKCRQQLQGGCAQLHVGVHRAAHQLSHHALAVGE